MLLEIHSLGKWLCGDFFVFFWIQKDLILFKLAGRTHGTHGGASLSWRQPIFSAGGLFFLAWQYRLRLPWYLAFLEARRNCKRTRKGRFFMADDDQVFYDLLRGIKEGSEDAARQFLAQYGKYIRHVVRRHMIQKLRAKFDSEDFLQDVCVSFFSHPPGPEEFSDPAALLAFLGKIARNKVTDAARQRLAQRRDVNRENSLDGSAQFAVENLQGADPSASEIVRTEESWEALGQGGHPDQKKLLHMLRNGYTQEEIARVLGLSVRQVQRLVQKLRERFAENEPG